MVEVELVVVVKVMIIINMMMGMIMPTITCEGD
jgi:hypothetical protein